jgi:predicted  nucleic acid-binding Zn-ribbon protein
VDDQPPRRRIADRDRRRWNDHSLDQLSERVDRYATRLGDAEDQLEALRLLPEVMRDMREDIRDMRRRMDTRFDRADGAHERVEQKAEQIVTQTTRNPMKDFLIAALAAATGIGVPVALAVVLNGPH